MRRPRIVLLCSVGVLASCGAPSTMQQNGDLQQSADQAPPPADMTQMAATVPDPGPKTSTGSLFLDPPESEPNNMPENATPVGSWTPDNTGTFLLWITDNTFSSTDQADYYVFKTTAAGMFQLGSAGVCGSAANVISKIDVWKVIANQQVTPPIKEFTASGNCVPGTVALEASTTYLLGFFGGGAAGSYSA